MLHLLPIRLGSSRFCLMGANDYQAAELAGKSLCPASTRETWSLLNQLHVDSPQILRTILAEFTPINDHWLSDGDVLHVSRKLAGIDVCAGSQPDIHARFIFVRLIE